jgi:ABC-type spermidine/putrescine transport system permease subunit I
MTRRPHRGWLLLPSAPVVLMIVAGYFLPLVLVLAWVPKDLAQAFDTARDAMPTLARTVGISLLVAIVSLPIAVSIAQPLSLSPARARLLAAAVLAAPLVLNLLVVVLAWMVILEPDGLLVAAWHLLHLPGNPPALLYTPVASVVAMAYVVTPIMALLLLQTFSQIDPRAREAGRLLGASRVQRMVHLDLAFAAPSMVTSLILGYLICLNLYLIPEYLTGPRLTTLGMLIQLDVLAQFDLARAAVLSLMLMAAAVLPLALAMAFESRFARR